MKNLYVDRETNDLVVEKGRLKLTTTLTEAVAQKIQCRLKVVQGEWFLDSSFGLPWFTRIFKKAPDFNDIKTIFVSTILDTEGVDSLLSFTPKFNKKTRTYSFTFSAKLENGDIIQEQTISGVTL